MNAQNSSSALRQRVMATAAALAPVVIIPFRAPTVLLGVPNDDSTFTTIHVAEGDRYDVVFGDENCDGGTYCRVARVTGRRITDVVRAPEGRPITLPVIGRASFAPSVCGANCSDAVVTWDEGGVRYSIGLKAGELRDFVRIARSVVKLP